MGEDRPARGKDPSGGKAIRPGLALFFFLVFVTVIVVFMDLVWGSMLFVLYPGPPLWVYLMITGSAGLFIFLAQFVSHAYHRGIMQPIYLTSSILLAVHFYALIASLAAGLILSVDLVVEIPYLWAAVRAIYPLVVLVPIAWGMVWARRLGVRDITVLTDKPLDDRIKVFFLSDLHLGLLIGRGRAGRILELARDHSPDAILLGGDIFDTPPKNVPWASSFLKELPRIAPTFFVTGNHEAFNELEECLETIRSSGIRILSGEGSMAGGRPLWIFGIDDPSDLKMPGEGGMAIPGHFRGLPEAYSVFLVHRPVLSRFASSRGFDMQISGHTHYGQMFPFNLATYLAFGPRHRGKGLVGNMIVYTSSGAGTWGPPMRFMTGSEVVIVTIDPRG